MKKLIAISVIFALVTGAAFAQAAIGVEVFAVSGVKGGGNADLDPTGYFGINRARLAGSGQNDAGSIGAAFRLDAGSINAVAPNEWDGTAVLDGTNANNGWFDAAKISGLAWWKPIEQIKLQIGTNWGDGEWGLEGLTGWGWEGLAYEVGLGTGTPWSGIANVNRREVYFSGFNGTGRMNNQGIYLGIYPIEGLTINVGVPLDEYGPGALIEDAFKLATFQGTYNLDGVGLFGVTYKGAGEEDGKIFVFADLAIVDGLGLNVGFSYDLEAEQIGVGVAAAYDITDEFNIKASIVFLNDDTSDYAIGFDLLPSYKINDTMTAFVSVNITTFDGDDAISYSVAPYLKVSTGWAQDFYAGVKLTSENDADMDWNFVLGMTVGF